MLWRSCSTTRGCTSSEHEARTKGIRMQRQYLLHQLTEYFSCLENGKRPLACLVYTCDYTTHILLIFWNKIKSKTFLAIAGKSAVELKGFLLL